MTAQPPGHTTAASSSPLPYVDTLHYAGCGCHSLAAAGAASTAAAQRVDALVAGCALLHRSGLLPPARPLRVGYLLPHHNITGGMKALCEHIRLLRGRGHYVVALHRSTTATRAVPPWSDVQADADAVAGLHQRLPDVYPLHTLDALVVGIFHQVAEALATVPCAVVYFEQGHEWLFGDPIRLQQAQSYARQDALFHMAMRLPAASASVSDAVSDILRQEFGRSPVAVPNGVDCERFRPGPRDDTLVPNDVAAALGTAAAAVAAGALVGGSGGRPLSAPAVAAVSSACAVQAETAGGGGGGGAAAAAAATVAAAAAVASPAKPGAVNPSNALTGDHNAGSSSWSSGSSRHPYGYHATAPSGPDDLERQSAPPAPLPQGAAPASLLMPPHMPPPSIPAAPAAVSASAPPKSVLLVGNPGLPLKGFDTAVRVLVAASCLLPVTVTWVCQQLPSPLTVPSLFTLGAGLSIRYFVSPSQADIPRLYRGHDALLFTSRYEAWGLPVMEALASGLAVVTTDCLGVKSFARHGANCLMARPDDVAGLVMQLVAVLSDGALRGALQAAARATALQFTPDAVTDRLESLLYGLTACSSELMQARQQCAADIHATCAWASQACSGNR